MAGRSDQAVSAPPRMKDSESVSHPSRSTRSSSKRAGLSVSVTRSNADIEVVAVDETLQPENTGTLTTTEAEKSSSSVNKTTMKVYGKKRKLRRDDYASAALSIDQSSPLEVPGREQMKKLRSRRAEVVGEQLGGLSVAPMKGWSKRKRADSVQGEDEGEPGPSGSKVSAMHTVPGFRTLVLIVLCRWRDALLVRFNETRPLLLLLRRRSPARNRTSVHEVLRIQSRSQSRISQTRKQGLRVQRGRVLPRPKRRHKADVSGQGSRVQRIEATLEPMTPRPLPRTSTPSPFYINLQLRQLQLLLVHAGGLPHICNKKVLTATKSGLLRCWTSLDENPLSLPFAEPMVILASHLRRCLLLVPRTPGLCDHLPRRPRTRTQIAFLPRSYLRHLFRISRTRERRSLTVILPVIQVGGPVLTRMLLPPTADLRGRTMRRTVRASRRAPRSQHQP